MSGLISTKRQFRVEALRIWNKYPLGEKVVATAFLGTGSMKNGTMLEVARQRILTIVHDVDERAKAVKKYQDNADVSEIVDKLCNERRRQYVHALVHKDTQDAMLALIRPAFVDGIEEIASEAAGWLAGSPVECVCEVLEVIEDIARRHEAELVEELEMFRARASPDHGGD